MSSTPSRTVRNLVLAGAVLTAVSCLIGAAFAPAGGEAQRPRESAPPATVSIDWRSGEAVRVRMTPAEAVGALAALASRSDQRHVVVQFDGPVTGGQRAGLERAGVSLLTYLGDHAFFAALSPGGIDPALLANLPAVARVDAIEPAWKLHPAFVRGPVPEYAVVDMDSTGPIVAAYITFHTDMLFDQDGMPLVATYGGLVRDTISVVNGLVIELPLVNVAALAAEDAVAWIEPPLPPFSEWNDSNRSRTGADQAQSAPYNLTGAGVTVLVYDGGYARATHQDFGGRLTVRDSSGLSGHATHVSGTIGGSGAASGGLRKGMAPGVTLQSYGFQYDGTGIFLYSNPGDLQSDYNQAINTYGADISNNSIGTNTETNGFPCSIQGDYGVTDQLIDAIVRGSLGAPFRVIWANGNERQGSRCDVEGYGDYYSTAPPATAKNHITVGALNSNNDSMTSFSSWGPTDDGRMKPDISAPGCQSDADFGVTSCYSGSDTQYASLCGTSMASPTVCGLSSLLLEDYRAQFGGADPRNSTLKILWAHTAVDLGNVGPDYQFGYGSVRVVPAIDFLRSGNFREASVDQGGTASYTINVAAGTSVLKVTLAWDDAPGTPNVNPALINDLDLRVFDPSANQAFPWTLNPTNPSAAAVRTQRNSRDNIEQVLVDNPAAGTWTVEVFGFNVPQGPQPFSLCASPNLNAGGGCPPPAAPTGVSATDGATCVDVTLSWNPVGGAIEYQVFRNTTNNSGSAAQIATVAASPFVDATVVPGTTYFYWLKTVDVCGPGGFSASDSGFAATVPAAPTGVSASDGSSCSAVNVSWNASAGATGYEIWRNAVNDSGSAALIGTDNASPFADGSATPGATYYYWLRATSVCGTSGFSASDAGSRAATPGAPTGVSASDGTSCTVVTVSWNAVGGATGYQIWRNTVNDSATAAQIGTDTASPFDDGSAAGGTTYYYWVKATNACGAGAFSVPDTGYRGSGSAPPPPTNVNASDRTYCDFVRVTWNASAGATSYEIWRSTSQNSSSASLIGTAAASPFDDASAVPGQRYYYWVKAKNACGTSGFSNRDAGRRRNCN